MVQDGQRVTKTLLDLQKQRSCNNYIRRSSNDTTSVDTGGNFEVSSSEHVTIILHFKLYFKEQMKKESEHSFVHAVGCNLPCSEVL